MNRYVVSFAIFSFLGWVWESIYCTICQKKWANRGFLYGPVCPIYGFGGTIGLLAYDLAINGIFIELNWWQIFILGFIISMVLEYPTSYVLEKLFHARWWDYTGVPLNINGRTSVPTSVAFGVAAIFVMKFIIPFVDVGLNGISYIFINAMAMFFISAFSIDTTLTITALTDFEKHVALLDENFQKHMTEVVDKIYSNRGTFFRNAAKRTVLFKFPERKLHIARLLLEKKIEELLKEFNDENE